RLLRGEQEPGAAALADAEEAEALGIGVGPAFEIPGGGAEIVDLEGGDPLQRVVALVGWAFALAAHLEGEDVVALIAQEVGIGDAGPAVGAELQAEEDDAFAGGAGLQVAAFEDEVVGRGQVDV